MREVNGNNEPRPIKVIDAYSFSIENTSQFKRYERGGFAQLMKVPFRINFESFAQQIVRPNFAESSTVNA